MKEKLKRLNEFEWLVPKGLRKEMRVNAKIIANDIIMGKLDDKAIEQLTNVACLPGILEPVVGLPDMHWGYGLPVGAVGAFDSEEGVISAGMCGFDINCGINSIRTNLTVDEIKPKLKELLDVLFKNIPVGVGAKGRLKLTNEQLDEVMVRGVDWAIENGFGTEDDKEHLEEKGHMEGGDPSKVSDVARKRGAKQLGTLGAGNHFLEIQRVSDIFDEETAKRWGIHDTNQVMIMIHCGSRGFGHQVATDYLKIQERAVKKYDIWLPDPQLACAPVNSPEGRDYFAAMVCAVNYSFTNRLVITQWVRESFEKVFHRDWESMGMHTIYGLAHNVVKLEEYVINGKKRKVYVHRKGSTRSFPGDPVLIAGSMGTASYMLLGAELSLSKSFGSTVHGSGREMSRHAAIKKFRGTEIQRSLASRGILTKAPHPRGIAEEAPQAYKNVEDVIESVHGIGISKKVVRLVPMGVLKG